LRELSVKGRNLSEGVPRSFTLNSNEILEALQEPLQEHRECREAALEQTPPERARTSPSVASCSPAAARCCDIDKLLTEETGLPVVVRMTPDLRGTRWRAHSRADG